MSQPKSIDIGESVKLVLATMVLVVLSACVEPVTNPDIGAAQHIYISHGSVWRGGIELELSESAGESSIFEDTGKKWSSPHGIGRRAKLNIGVEEFRYVEKTLQSLETKAFPESEIEERLRGHFTLGYDCKQRITDNVALFVEWKYPNGDTWHAFYDTGCQNLVTQHLRNSYFEFVKKLRQGIPEDQWFKSTSRNVEEVAENE